MSATSYKSACASPGAFRRSSLEDTVRALAPTDQNLALAVKREIGKAPIPKPTGHAGGEEADFFRVTLEAAIAERIVEALRDMEAASVSEEGETTSLASHYGSLLDLWYRYAESEFGNAI